MKTVVITAQCARGSKHTLPVLAFKHRNCTIYATVKPHRGQDKPIYILVGTVDDYYIRHSETHQFIVVNPNSGKDQQYFTSIVEAVYWIDGDGNVSGNAPEGFNPDQHRLVYTAIDIQE